MLAAIDLARKERHAAAFFKDLVVFALDGLVQTLVDLLFDLGFSRADQHDDIFDLVAVKQVIYDLQSP